MLVALPWLRMKTPTRVLSVLATVVTLCLGASGQAVAERASVDDARGDASAPGDITSAKYMNDQTKVSGRIRLRHLTNGGRFELVAAVPDSDSAFGARVWHRPGGGVKTRLVFIGNLGVERHPCPQMDAAWRKGRDLVRVSFPRDCIPDMPNRLYMRSNFKLGQSLDFAPKRVLNRG
jgi:hypothetical protein